MRGRRPTCVVALEEGGDVAKKRFYVVRGWRPTCVVALEKGGDVVKKRLYVVRGGRPTPFRNAARTYAVRGRRLVLKTDRKTESPVSDISLDKKNHIIGYSDIATSLVVLGARRR